MKIYYYKQQQNTFELFGKKTSTIRFRYVAGSLLLILMATIVCFKIKPHNANDTAQHASTSILPSSNQEAVQQLSPGNLDAETQATSLNIQTNIEASSAGTEEIINSKPEQQSLFNSKDNKVQTITIKKRDTLGKIFTRLAVNKKEVSSIMHANDQAETLKRLKPGQKISLIIRDHKVQQLTYNTDSINTLVITRTGDNSFKSLVKTANLEPKQTFTRFTVYSSISTAAKKAGLDSKRTAQLASIFKSSVDLGKGNHTGDTVSVLFQDYYSNGKKIKDGEIVAAEYKTATNTYQAVRFTDPKGNSGYYAPDGTSMQKRFLPAPVKFTRISSLFNPKRWHPVLHRFRHHQGVDYAAPYGTPIKSVANGTIALLGRKGGYGNTIMIKHDSSYSTLYGHLSKYATNLKVGSQVQQGQVIGYVGSSGLATGPHLHFEFRINGVHRNPLTVALPNGKSITHAYRIKFHNEVKKLLAKLDAHKHSNSG